VLRGADAIVFCHAAPEPPAALEVIRRELAAAGIERPCALAITKLDEAETSRVDELARASGLPAVGVSVLDDASLDALRATIWELTGLIRVFLRAPGAAEAEAQALDPGATVVDAARTVHHDLAASCTGARISGPSAKFPGQRVGREHVLADGDIVEIG
jgi:ribosome-interacting GTPase 1